jgi:ubiquinol-cytochrome c reductase cytochrome b subunit
MYILLKKSMLVDVVFSNVKAFLIRYPAPTNIGYLWNFGSLSGLFLVVQIITGLLLTMYYTPHTFFAFFSVDHIVKNINFGWLVRYIHANGASFFFFFIYLHFFRGFFFGSYKYPRTTVWFTGITIYLLLMGTAFLGYVLPWGQMSFWAATVITNFLSVIPMIGDDLVYWLWGGFSISNATLNRFFCLHYLLPFIICIVVVLHLIMLHQASSTNELRVRATVHTRISFHPSFIIKDIVTVCLALLAFGVIVFFLPDIFNHSVNYVPANLLVTPRHIVPEWYFLPYYAILRSILDKTIGICAFALSVVMLYLFPIIDNCVGLSKLDNESHRQFAWFFFFNFLFLCFLGSETTEYPCIEFGTFSTMIYFFLPLVLLPCAVYKAQLYWVQRYEISSN